MTPPWNSSKSKLNVAQGLWSGECGYEAQAILPNPFVVRRSVPLHFYSRCCNFM